MEFAIICLAVGLFAGVGIGLAIGAHLRDTPKGNAILAKLDLLDQQAVANTNALAGHMTNQIKTEVSNAVAVLRPVAAAA